MAKGRRVWLFLWRQSAVFGVWHMRRTFGGIKFFPGLKGILKGFQHPSSRHQISGYKKDKPAGGA